MRTKIWITSRFSLALWILIAESSQRPFLDCWRRFAVESFRWGKHYRRALRWHFDQWWKKHRHEDDSIGDRIPRSRTSFSFSLLRYHTNNFGRGSDPWRSSSGWKRVPRQWTECKQSPVPTTRALAHWAPLHACDPELRADDDASDSPGCWLDSCAPPVRKTPSTKRMCRISLIFVNLCEFTLIYIYISLLCKKFCAIHLSHDCNMFSKTRKRQFVANLEIHIY